MFVRTLNIQVPYPIQFSDNPNTIELGTLTPNGSFSMGMIQKVGTSFNHVGGFQ